MRVLSAEEIASSLGGLDGWVYDGSVIAKEYRWPAFADAVSFVVRVAFAAESRNHHPDIDVRYNRVRLALATHSQGGVTDLDVELATEIERLASS